MVANNAVKICYKQVYAIEVDVGWSSNDFKLRNAWSSELGLEGGRGGMMINISHPFIYDLMVMKQIPSRSHVLLLSY